LFVCSKMKKVAMRFIQEVCCNSKQKKISFFVTFL
jgi:hypothetical protein